MVTGNRDVLVTIDRLVCQGCYEPVRPEPPAGSELGDGFTHRDGSVLCGEPVETAEAS